MSVPTRKQVARNMKLKQMWKELNKHEKDKSEPINEEEHQKRIKMLKEMGLLKDGN
jgi:hypothetical protein